MHTEAWRELIVYVVFQPERQLTRMEHDVSSAVRAMTIPDETAPTQTQVITVATDFSYLQTNQPVQSSEVQHMIDEKIVSESTSRCQHAS